MAQPTHRHDLAHRGLVPVSQLASGVATSGMVPAYAGTLSAVWTALGSLGALTNPMTTQDDVIVGGVPVGGVAPPARLGKGTDGQVLTVDPTTHHLLWATPKTVATDVIWDAAGDVAVGTGADTAARLALTVPAANVLNALGVVNGETTPTWKSLMDATVATTQASGDAASAGTGTLLARITHKHGMPALQNLAAGATGDMSAEAIGSTVAAGSTGKYSDAGHRHAMPAAGAAGDIGAETSGCSAAAGSTGKIADAGHIHSLPTIPTVPAFGAAGDIVATADDATKAAGASGKVADAAHQHGIVSYASTPAAIGTGAAGTSGAAPARGDHVHPFPTAPSVQNLMAATQIVIPAGYCGAIPLTASTGNKTLTATPTLTDGTFDGQWVILENLDTTYNITVQDRGTLAGSKLNLVATTQAIAKNYGNLHLSWSAANSRWIQVGALVTPL